MTNPENEEKINELVKKLNLPPHVDVDKLEADLKAALEEIKCEAKEKIKSVIEGASIELKTTEKKVW